MSGTGTRIVMARRCAQALSAFLLVYILWNTRYPLEGYINPKFYFQIDPFAMFVTAIAERVLIPGILYASAVLVLTLIIGRFFCGWLCPLGALLDLLSYIIMKIKKLFRIKKREAEPHPLRFLKYGVLCAAFAFALFGVQLAWAVDPITIFVRAFSFNAHPLIDGGINAAFISILEAAGYPEWLESLYNSLREGFLSLSTPYFPHTGLILSMLVLILALSLIKRRFWCRYLCPLGAFLALPARFSFLRRDVEKCTTNCGSCKNICRMNAIKEDNSYIAEECVLCMDCMADCPRGKSTFSFKLPVFKVSEQKFTDNYRSIEGSEQLSWSQGTNLPITIGPAGGQSNFPGVRATIKPAITREKFIHAALLALTPLPVLAANLPKTIPRAGTASSIRPPGALPEDEFIRRCIRCGACMKVCPTNVLQPASAAGRPGTAWAPVLDTRRGYCEYQCNLCGQVCPTGAIRKLSIEEKQKVKIGIAVFNKRICLPYAKGEDCIVCEEHCPVKGKAIRVREGLVKGKRVRLPYVVTDLCIGCSICELKCPTAPDKGIIVVKVREA
ncbi:MAG: 4Fe-4S binding protein [Spirochaetes bacterium]|nr:4Fe-4S binding protein [Spirochaetota bacterium]